MDNDHMYDLHSYEIGVHPDSVGQLVLALMVDVH
jgi:hypothetical protein